MDSGGVIFSVETVLCSTTHCPSWCCSRCILSLSPSLFLSPSLPAILLHRALPQQLLLGMCVCVCMSIPWATPVVYVFLCCGLPQLCMCMFMNTVGYPSCVYVFIVCASQVVYVYACEYCAVPQLCICMCVVRFSSCVCVCM